MKLKFSSICLILALILCIITPLAAATEAGEPQLGFITDSMYVLSDDELGSLLAESQRIAEQYGVGLHVVTLEDYSMFNAADISEATQEIYTTYGLGVGENKLGSLIFLAPTSAEGYAFDYGYFDAIGLSQDEQNSVRSMFETTFSETGSMYDALMAYMSATESVLSGESVPTTGAAVSSAQASFDALEAAMASHDGYVFDTVGILSNDEIEFLEEYARELTENIGISPYIVVLDDFTAYNATDSYTAATEIYKRYDLGHGDGKDGMILMLSMSARDYGYAMYGDHAHSKIDRDQLNDIEEAFLEEFAEDDWYGGFYDYMYEIKYVVQYAWIVALVIIIMISFVIALVVCFSLRAQLRSVKFAKGAVAYVPQGGVNIHTQHDNFSHTTTTRTKIQKSSGGGGGGGGGGRSGGGFSGGGGKF